ncbi:MAG: TonB-dependent receptor [Bacteroidia bacterium]|nr:TonB-dependent receptor [Bacteroidia bacterium]
MISFRRHIFSLFTISLFTLHLASAQENLLNKLISVSLKEKPLPEVLDVISKSAGIYFTYSNERIPVDSLVTIEIDNMPLYFVFNELFSKRGIDYLVIEDHVILNLALPKESSKPKYSVSGFIKDIKTGEALGGATIICNETKEGTCSNVYGFYSLTLPEGIHEIEFSFLGYKKINIKVDLHNNQRINLDMEADMSLLQEVVITANVNVSIENVQMSNINITILEVQKLPGFLGEIDLIKSLQAMPGITSCGDGSVFYYIRGGNKDQNLILVDEAPIYNPAHVLGIYSIFIADAVKEMKIYKGDIPANRGGRLSSLLEVTTKDGNMKNLGVSGKLGLIASNLSVEGPVVKDRCSFFASARRSHLEWIFKPSYPDLQVYFYDLNSKINYRLNDKTRIFLSGYIGNDYLGNHAPGQAPFGLGWNNYASSLRLNRVFNDRLFSNTTITASRYEYNLETSSQRNEYWTTSIINLGLKSNFTYYLNPKNTMYFGIDVSQHYFNPGNIDTQDSTVRMYIPLVSEGSAREICIFASNEQKISKKLSVRYGLRIPVWQNLGPGTVYLFDESHAVHDTLIFSDNKPYHTYINFEPRLSLSYSLNSQSSVKAGYNRTSQNLHLLSNSTSPFTSLEVWLPSGLNIKPQIANQCALGYYRILKKFGIEITTEIFYRYLRNQIDYKDHAKMLLNPFIEGELRFGNVWAYGADVMIYKSVGKLSGWLGYTYSRAFARTKEVNGGLTYPAFSDRPNDITIAISYQYKRLRFSSNWIYVTGAPVTTPTSFYYYQGHSLPYYAKKNNDRLPPYHRLDVAVNWEINKPEKRFQHNLTVAIYNVYARKNPISVNFNKIASENGRYVIPVDLNSYPEYITTRIFVTNIVPSISYNFKF